MHIFKEVLFFQVTYNRKTEKQTINSLSLCQFDTGMLAEGKGHETDMIKQRAWLKSLERRTFWKKIACFVLLKSILVNPSCVLAHRFRKLLEKTCDVHSSEVWAQLILLSSAHCVVLLTVYRAVYSVCVICLCSKKLFLLWLFKIITITSFDYFSHIWTHF